MFLLKRRSPDSNRTLRELSPLKDWKPKLASLIIAYIIFIFYQLATQSERIFVIPITTNLPKSMTLKSQSAKTIKLQLTGSISDLKSFNKSDFEAYLNIDPQIQNQTAPVKIQLRNDKELSHSTRITIDPKTISVSLDEKLRTSLPIDLTISGYPANGYDLVGYTVSPEKIEVTGPKSLFDEIKSLRTTNIDISGEKESYETETQILIPNPQITLLSHPAIIGSIEIVPRLRAQTLVFQPVITGLSPNLELQSVLPPQIKATLQGRQIDFETLQDSKQPFQPTVDAGDIFSPGRYSLPVLWTQLPEELTLLNSNPERITIITRETR